jgi:threonylcarbamoyladenosine tRNA methylthiotransferase MtaB
MKIYLDTIGCRLNQSEIETFARQFRAAGHELVPYPAEADLAVVNTCSVTAAAAADSRKKIRGMQRSGAAEVIVTGCWSTLEPEAAAALKGVRLVVPNAEKEDLVRDLLEIPADDFDLEPLARKPIPGGRARTRAFIKVQDGCDNRCTFCITTLARGPGRSLPVQQILEDIRYALDGGCQEIVLTGVHLGSWGQDFAKPAALSDLVRTILEDTDAPRLRLSSLEPWDIDDDFFRLWQDPRLARHLHLPLQSGCESTLRRMARKTTPEKFAKLVSTARSMIPEVAITTDIIVGFPGETEAEFAESLAFTDEMAFARGHVFTYSERQGTAAARMPERIPHPERKKRSSIMRDLLAQSERAYQERFVGTRGTVLWESSLPWKNGSWKLIGLTDNYLRVTTVTPEEAWNQITTVKLQGIYKQGMVGRIIKDV